MRRQFEAFLAMQRNGAGVAAPAPAAEPSRVAERAPRGNAAPHADQQFAVQAGAFRTETAAAALAQRLEGGFTVMPSPGKSFFLVRSPAFATRAEAAELLQRTVGPDFTAIIVRVDAGADTSIGQQPAATAPAEAQPG